MAFVTQHNCLFHLVVQKQSKLDSQLNQKLPFGITDNFKTPGFKKPKIRKRLRQASSSRNRKNRKSKAHRKNGPFGFWDPRRTQRNYKKQTLEKAKQKCSLDSSMFGIFWIISGKWTAYSSSELVWPIRKLFMVWLKFCIWFKSFCHYQKSENEWK